MLSIHATLSEPLPPASAFSEMSLDDVYSYIQWEANVTVAYNDRVIFSESVAIAEFYRYLVRWYRGFLSGDRSPFAYRTVEHSEPILTFAPISPHRWVIDSIWSQCAVPITVDEGMLCSEVRRFTEELPKE